MEAEPGSSTGLRAQDTELLELERELAPLAELEEQIQPVPPSGGPPLTRKRGHAVRVQQNPPRESTHESRGLTPAK
eukprot:COSAG02_NODE_39964_length_410_cov_1.662379_1_plen_75_part_10